MKKNVGSLDKKIRFILGVVFAVVAIFYSSGILQIIFGVLTLIMFVTSIIGICPLYILLGINTDKTTEKDSAVNQ